MSKIGVKLDSFSEFQKGGTVKKKYVVVSTLEELCVKGMNFPFLLFKVTY
jgi:hypothetical protein